MAEETVVSCTLDVNGQQIDDFKRFRELPVDLYRRVKTVNGTKVAKRNNPDLGVEVDYLVPAAGAEFDWAGLEDATLTVEYEGGRRVTYSGVYPAIIGGIDIDGENDAVRTIELIALRKQAD